MKSRGFTLIELVVVLAVFGLFSVMAYGGLNYVLKARKAIEVQLERIAEFQKAFQRVRNDLELATPRPARDAYGQPGPAFVFEEFGARIELTRSGWRNPLSLPRPSLERIVYRYDDRRKEFVRETWRVLDRAEERDPLKLVVLGNIDDARWRFMDASRQWTERWPPQSTTPTVPGTASTLLPKAIELTLESKDFGEIVWLLRPGVEAVVPTPSTAGNNSGAVNGGNSSSSGGNAGTGGGGGGGG